MTQESRCDLVADWIAGGLGIGGTANEKTDESAPGLLEQIEAELAKNSGAVHVVNAGPPRAERAPRAGRGT